MQVLFKVCGVSRRKQLIARYYIPAKQDRFNTFHLFLYATENGSGKPAIARFVEGEKPLEPLKLGQTEEIAFLKGLGLHARVLRLDERVYV